MFINLNIFKALNYPLIGVFSCGCKSPAVLTPPSSRLSFHPIRCQTRHFVATSLIFNWKGSSIVKISAYSSNLLQDDKRELSVHPLAVYRIQPIFGDMRQLITDMPEIRDVEKSKSRANTPPAPGPPYRVKPPSQSGSCLGYPIRGTIASF